MGALAAGVAPAILRAAEEPVILGSGEHKYEWVKGWGKLPAGKSYGNAHAVQVVEDGRVFIHNQSVDSVCIFEPDGKFIESWGPEYKGGAHGMQLRKEGNEEVLYLALTSQNRVVKTDLKGKVIWEKKDPPAEYAEQYTKLKQHYVPTNIALAPDGGFYVADGYGSSFVHQYDKDATYVRTFGGKKNQELGSLNCCHGIYIDQRSGNPIVCVADRSNKRIQNFTMDGKPINVVTEDLRSPCHFDTRGTELLIPDLEGRVTIFDKDNKLIVHLGDNPNPAKRGSPGNKVPQSEWKDGIFHTPHGACFDKDGNIYVTEWLAPVGRVTKLKKLA
jgi:sugar lactone lactonase YvrE